LGGTFCFRLWTEVSYIEVADLSETVGRKPDYMLSLLKDSNIRGSMMSGNRTWGKMTRRKRKALKMTQGGALEFVVLSVHFYDLNKLNKFKLSGSS
jgi:hypothetical protein